VLFWGPGIRQDVNMFFAGEIALVVMVIVVIVAALIANAAMRTLI
jgi:hypothetical protein